MKDDRTAVPVLRRRAEWRRVACSSLAAACAYIWAAQSAVAESVKIAPVYFSNSPDKQSNLRLINLTGAAGTVTVTIRSATGVALGTWTKQIAANTAPQFTMKDVETGASITAPVPVAGATNTGTVEITSTFDGQLQHVVYNPVGGALTNLSLCFNASTDTSNVTNVHTSLFASNYPSTITITNTGAAAQAGIVVSDSLTGAQIGQYNSSVIGAGGALTVTETAIESQLGFTPGANQLHLTMKLTGAFSGSLSHTVDNLISGVMTDMTARCRMGAN